MLNPYFSIPDTCADSERSLMDDLTREAIQIYGFDVWYIPRTLGREDKILGEDSRSVFTQKFLIEAFIETHLDTEGAGELATKFGLEIQDQYTISINQKRFKQAVSDQAVLIASGRPNEGDLVFMDNANLDNPNPNLWQVVFVEYDKPHYQLGDIYLYKLKMERFKYSNEVFSVGIPALDNYGAETGIDTVLHRIGLENGSTLLLENGDGMVMDTAWHNDTAPERTYGGNDQFQQEATEIVEFSITNPFGEGF